MDYYILITVGFVVLMPPNAVSRQCNKIDSCSCVFDDDSGMIDLTSLKKTDGFPLFLDEPSTTDSYMYSYNPCGPFTEAGCVDVAGCQYEPLRFTFHEIGSPDKVTFDYNGLNVVAKYDSKDGARKSSVTLLCDPSATKPKLEVIGETTTTHYEFTLRASAACIVPTPNSSGGLSAGTILLIIFFSSIVAYLVAGLVFNKLKRKQTGKDLAPNIEFWSTIPVLIKEGFFCTIGLVRGKRSQYTPT